jgi:hypothetical protein
MAGLSTFIEHDLPLVPSTAVQDPVVFTELQTIYTAIQVIAAQLSLFITLSEDLRVDSGSRGVILKDNQATPHYWRITVSNVGVLIITDIGTSLPT